MRDKVEKQLKDYLEDLHIRLFSLFTAAAGCWEVSRTGTRAAGRLQPGQEHVLFRLSTGLPRSSMAWLIGHYTSGPDQRRDPGASPLFAEFKNLPAEAYVITAECDVLRDEGEKYAEKLKASGVETVLTRFPGMLHGFFDMASVSDKAAEAREEILNNIKEGL
jgi:acetyl esterase/lipase